MHLLAKHFPIFYLCKCTWPLFNKATHLKPLHKISRNFWELENTMYTCIWAGYSRSLFFLRISAVLQLDIWPFIEWSNVTTTPLKLLYRMPRIFVSYEELLLSTSPCKSQEGPMQALHTINFKFVYFFLIGIQIKPR